MIQFSRVEDRAGAGAVMSSGVLEFSTDALPERDRVSIWREEFARGVVKMDVRQLDEEAFRSESRIRILPDLKIWSSRVTSCTLERTPSLVADGDDTVVLGIIKRGRTAVTQRGQEAFFSEGEAFLWASDTVGHYRSPGEQDFVTFAFSRENLARTVADVDKALLKAIPASTEALRLLIGYADILQHAKAPTEPETLALSAAHIHDLATLALGATRDAAVVAKGRGLRAARLRAIKSDILANLSRPGLAVAELAARHGISPRYIRALFESEQTSFTEFVREHRLQRAHRILGSTASTGRSIAAIAFDCGFGDLSYFNHSFRRRYGATPTDIRNHTHGNSAANSPGHACGSTAAGR
jgi:AraC-like DNA-binding protein